MEPTLATRLANLSEDGRREFLQSLSPAELQRLEFTWRFWARTDQLPPEGDWRTWLLLGGRGSGKTRSAAEWIRDEVESGRRRYLGIVGPTADAIRKFQIEGQSGILATAPPWNRPSYEPSTRRLVWPNGAIANLFSAEEPGRLRGPNLDGAWLDEIAAWEHSPEAVWDNLQLALRIPGPLGDPPRAVISTTPKPMPLLRAILADPSRVTTRGRTQDNAPNLDASTLSFFMNRYGGTSLGRQELDGELMEDLEGALWQRSLIENSRHRSAPANLIRIVVAIDPAGGATRRSDETGIVVAGIDKERHAYVLADLSGRYTPQGWALKATGAYERFNADRIVAEANFGGAMVEATLRAVAPDVPVKMVHASRGKVLRAEPIVALYEQGRVHHVGQHQDLEDQMCQWEPGVGDSPDRVDALVWAITELTGQSPAEPARFAYIPKFRGEHFAPLRGLDEDWRYR